MKPACMSDEDYERWDYWNERIIAIAGKATSPCEDCCAAFAREMLEQGRCDGRPGSRMPRIEAGDDPLPTVHELLARGYSGQMLASIMGAAVRKRERYRRQAEAVELYNEGRSQAEVAQLMGISQSAVSKYVRDAREHAA